MMAAPAQVLDGSRELANTRVYNVPKELLFRMWSNPQHITNWWGPQGFSTTTHAMDFKTDGIWRFTMHGPDGTDYPSVIHYTCISDDCIEYDQTGSDGTAFTARVAFREVANGTEMNFKMTFATSEIREMLVKRFGAYEGLLTTMARLDSYSAEQDPGLLELAIVRQFDAPQERVWKALTDPTQLRQWLCPIGLTMELAAGELKVGAKWTTVMSHGADMQFEADGEYLTIEPIHLLQMTHRWKKDDGTYKPTTTVTYRLHGHEGKTTMTFVQSGFWSEESRAAHLGGWDSCVQQLAKLVGSTRADSVLSLSRELDAPVDLVWKCWTEPKRLASWFAPRPYTCPRCEIDLTPGGSLLLVMLGPSGDEHLMSSIIVDVEPNSRLGWISSVLDENGEIALHGGATIIFEDLGGRTKVTVNSYIAAYTDPGVQMVNGNEQGWNMSLDQMIEVVTSLAMRPTDI